MSFDHIWLKTEGQRNKWLDCRAEERNGRGQELHAVADVLYAQGHYVRLSAGKNYLHDEIFLFRDISAAAEFYERGFTAWEPFPEGEEEGLGFQKVSLYRDGHLVAAKSCEPTKRIGVNHG
jgi:hypothetical protein